MWKQIANLICTEETNLAAGHLATRRSGHGETALTNVVGSLALIEIRLLVGRSCGNILLPLLKMLDIRIGDANVSQTTNAHARGSQLDPMPHAVQRLIAPSRQKRLGCVPRSTAGHVLVGTTQGMVCFHEITHGSLIIKLVARVFFVVMAVSRAVS